MSKSLKIIQTVSKVAKIISKVVFICCSVGASGCALGLITLDLGIQNLTLFGDKLSVVIYEKSGLTVNAMILACASGLILCTAECVVSAFAEKYFSNELRAGTPFTYEGSKEILRLGILTMAIPLGAEILCGIVNGFFSIFSEENTPAFETSTDSSLIIGGMFLLASVIFKYGAELREPKND